MTTISKNNVDAAWDAALRIYVYYNKGNANSTWVPLQEDVIKAVQFAQSVEALYEHIENQSRKD